MFTVENPDGTPIGSRDHIEDAMQLARSRGAKAMVYRASDRCLLAIVGQLSPIKIPRFLMDASVRCAAPTVLA